MLKIWTGQFMYCLDFAPFAFLHRIIAYGNSFHLNLNFQNLFSVACVKQYKNVASTVLGMPNHCRGSFGVVLNNFSSRLIQYQALCYCSGLPGEKSSCLFDHCLLLSRYYILSCKYKIFRPSSIEYVSQVRFELESNCYRNKYGIPTKVV